MGNWGKALTLALLACCMLAYPVYGAEKAKNPPQKSMAQKSAPQKKALGMAEAVELALKANPSVDARRLTIESARMNVGVAQSDFWPRVTITGSTQRLKNYEEVQTYSSDNLSSYNWSKGVRVSYALFAGFAHLNNLQRSLLSVDVEKARYRLSSLELACNVQLTFLQLLKCREDLKTALASVKRIQTQLQSSEAFVEVGMAPYLNVLQNKTDLAKANQQVIRAKNDIRNAEVQLNRYLGLPRDSQMRYGGDLKSLSGQVGVKEEEAITEALANRPDLEMAKKSVEVAFKDMNIAMGQFLPRVDVTYDNMSQSKDYDDSHYQGYTRTYWSAGLTFTWEVFSGGNTVFRTFSEKRRAESLRKDYEEAMNGARTEVIRALMDIESARELIAASTQSIESATESYQMAHTRYNTDTGTITELLDAQTRLTEAETSHSQALCDFHSARARLFYAMGRINPGLK